jgi:2-keto-3-deoxy-6-phosphogluconate aldolase
MLACLDHAQVEVILGMGTGYDAPTAVVLVDTGADFVVTAIVRREGTLFCDRGVLPTTQGPAAPR